MLGIDCERLDCSVVADTSVSRPQGCRGAVLLTSPYFSLDHSCQPASLPVGSAYGLLNISHIWPVLLSRSRAFFSVQVSVGSTVETNDGVPGVVSDQMVYDI